MLLTLGLLLALQSPAFAQPAETPEPAVQLDNARKDMDTVRTTSRDGLEDAQLLELRKQAQAAQAQADEAATALAPALADVQARLAELGTATAGVKESPDIAAQRAQLVKSQSTLDSQVKLARLLSVEAEQAAATIWAERRSQFSARLGERTRSVLSPTFWTELAADLPADLRRLRQLSTELQAAADAVKSGAWLAVAAAIAALLLLRAGLHRFLLHLTSTRVPPGRLRRSLHAVGVMAVWTFTPGLIAQALFLGLTSARGMPADLTSLLTSATAIVWFGGFAAGLGAALLMPGKPSWRLPPVSDGTATRLRWFPLLMALAIVVGWVSSRLSATIEASLATTVALNALTALTFCAVMMGALVQLKRSHRERQAEAAASAAGDADGRNDRNDKADAKQAKAAGGAAVLAVPLWLPTLRSLAWLLLAATLVGLASGYVALGNFVVGQLVWALIVLSSAYLLAVLVDDLFMTLLAPTAQPQGAADKVAEKVAEKAAAAGEPVPPAGPRTREQTAVLLSGLCRILIVLFALMLLAAPYGEGPLELVRRAGRLNEGLSIGEFSVRPAALLQAAMVLVVGLFGVRKLKDWLADRYMPTTRMDAGMRLSATTLFGYVGSVIVIALTMSAIGVGLERVAWVASALSVGIGFGLQAVVQNFVSGLILLAERPVKVGDWVSLSGVEGDIRRINVRATEIQMGDRSTVIVPNSEFITKIVRNVTHTDPIGLVQIKLPMPLSTDTAKARALLLEAFRAHPGVLPQPAPNVQLDGIDGANLVFNATGFVSSPRASYGVKSDLLFDVLDRLRAAGLPLAVQPTMLLSQAPPAPGAVPETSAAAPA